MRTAARRDGGDWILNGSKMWITNGTIADVAVVWARTESGEINGFLVERGADGFEAPEMKHKLSLRASVTSELILRDVRVPEENRFPEVSSLRGPLSCLNEARYGIVWGAVGAGRACFEAAMDYARERRVFTKPISAYQLTQQKLAEMALEVNRGTLLALHLGRMKDAGTLRPEHVSMGKMANVRGARGRADGAQHPRRERDHARVSGDPAHEQPRVRPHLRRDARGAHARRRRSADGRERVSLSAGARRSPSRRSTASVSTARRARRARRCRGRKRTP
jgi:alkylation response protein AidB-like acyl-CoA dehydrogenase